MHSVFHQLFAGMTDSQVFMTLWGAMTVAGLVATVTVRRLFRRP